MSVALLCGTQRGLRVLRELHALIPDHEVRVVTYLEAQGEPRFVDDVVAECARHGTRCEVTSTPVGPGHEWLWDDLDLVLMVHWRYLLPMAQLDRARRGAVVFHDSLLPAYRGFSPTVWAIANGESVCGVTAFHAAADVDRGDIILQEAVPVAPTATIATVVGDVTEAYVRVLRGVVQPLLDGTASRVPQSESAATYTCKRTREDDRIVWSESSRKILDLVRAVSAPYQGAWTTAEGERITVWRAEPEPAPRRWVRQVPGRVLEVQPGRGVLVMTGDGAVLIREVEVSEGGPVPAERLLRRLSLTLS